MDKTIINFNKDTVITKKSVVLETVTGLSINEVYILKDKSGSLYYVIANAYGTEFGNYGKNDLAKFNSILPIKNIPLYLINSGEDDITHIEIEL